jgi:outer membrane receptor protein involved in Fe transport
LGISRQQAGLLVSYELQDGWLKGHGASVALQHASRFPGTFSNDFFVRGATTAQLRVFRNAKPLSWSLSVSNLTDKKYFESGEGGLARGLKFGAPRTVSFSLGLEF